MIETDEAVEDSEKAVRNLQKLVFAAQDAAASNRSFHAGVFSDTGATSSLSPFSRRHRKVSLGYVQRSSGMFRQRVLKNACQNMGLIIDDIGKSFPSTPWARK